MNKKYQIIEAESREELEEVVNGMKQNLWEPLGGVSVVVVPTAGRGFVQKFYQAMKKLG